MSDATPGAPAQETMPATAPKVVKAEAKPFSPAAFTISPRPREAAIKALKEHTPPGNPKPRLLELARELALQLIDAHPEDVNGIEVKVEIGGHAAHQINVIVIPHKW